MYPSPREFYKPSSKPNIHLCFNDIITVPKNLLENVHFSDSFLLETIISVPGVKNLLTRPSPKCVGWSSRWGVLLTQHPPQHGLRFKLASSRVCRGRCFRSTSQRGIQMHWHIHLWEIRTVRAADPGRRAASCIIQVSQKIVFPPAQATCTC